MDDQARAIKWYLDNSAKLDLRIKKYKWNLPFDSNIVDCQATIKIDGHYFEGRGSDFSDETAFLKALGEALDRFLHFKYKGEASTTSGFATHVNFEKAIKASQYEIIERDKFLCHFLTNTPFYSSSIDLDQLKINKDFFSYLDNRKVEFNLMEMRKSKMASSFIFWASGLRASTPFGLSFGLGCHQNPIDAATSAVFEGLRHIQWILEQENLEYLNFAEFGNKSDPLISQHIKLALNPQYFKEVSVLFGKINQNENIMEEDFKFQIEQLALSEIGTDCPIVGIRSKSDCAQNLYFGKTVPEVINLKRLKSFLKRDVKWTDISKIIHPMG